MGAPYTIIIVRKPQNSIGNYYGPHVILKGSWDLVTRVIIKVTILIEKLITPIKALITILTKSHDPLSTYTPPKAET